MIPSIGPNLARAPFVNARPVRRLSVVLWLLALGLLGWNVRAYLDSGAGATARRADLTRLRKENAETRARIQTLEDDLRRADLIRVNLQTEYLNQRIAERAFSWNLLLDDMAQVLPRQVRVQRLAPEGFRDDRSLGTGRTPSSAERRVSMRLSGEAADDEALLEFVDRLFAHPSFDSPNLSSESRNRSGSLDFELTVGYRAAGKAGVAAREATVATSPGPRSTPTPGGGDGATGDAPPQAGPAGATSSPLPADEGLPAVAAGEVATVGSALEPRAAPAPAPVARGANGRVPTSVTTKPAVGTASEPTLEPAVAAPTPALSIFGVPLSAKPYASGGGR